MPGRLAAATMVFSQVPGSVHKQVGPVLECPPIRHCRLGTADLVHHRSCDSDLSPGAGVACDRSRTIRVACDTGIGTAEWSSRTGLRGTLAWHALPLRSYFLARLLFPLTRICASARMDSRSRATASQPDKIRAAWVSVEFSSSSLPSKLAACPWCHPSS